MRADLIDLSPSLRSMKEEVLEGLGAHHKWLPAKFFYDRRGSALFDRICRLPEYYPTRTELKIMKEAGDEIARALGPDCVIVEFGSGSSDKVRLILDMLQRPRGYMPIDISRKHLAEAASNLARDYPDINVTAICADFTLELDLRIAGLITGRLVGFFPGSTIGNFSPEEAHGFLKGTASMLGSGAGLLIGVDLKKPPEILNAAYNDREGITSAFNLNILNHINRELDGTFDPDLFRHHAFYNGKKGRVEMHLVSLRRQTVEVAGVTIPFEEGETIHTENSYKYSVDEFREKASAAGYRPLHCWTDSDRLFSVHFLEVAQ